MYSKPNEADIQKVMKDTGMDYLQAIRHLQGRHILQERLQRNSNPYPLGKSQHFA
jgi:hypothetical protein